MNEWKSWLWTKKNWRNSFHMSENPQSVGHYKYSLQRIKPACYFCYDNWNFGSFFNFFIHFKLKASLFVVNQHTCFMTNWVKWYYVIKMTLSTGIKVAKQNTKGDMLSVDQTTGYCFMSNNHSCVKHSFYKWHVYPFIARID